MTIDCADPASLATFWSEALGWPAPWVHENGGGAVCGPPGGGLYLEFIRVPESKVVKNRLHLGTTTGSVEEHQAEVDRLVGLGARIGWKERFGPEVDPHYRNWVLLDPEGNEFCLGGGSWPEGVAVATEAAIERG